MAPILPPKDAPTSAALAEAWGWQSGEITSRRVTRAGGLALELATSSIAGQGAVVFAQTRAPASQAELNAVSLFGYHASCPWGIVADPEGVHLLSSHWVQDSEWYRLPRIGWDNFGNHERLISAFTPEAVRDSEPQRALWLAAEPTSVLRSVDDALVERLDLWRERAVRFSRAAVSKVDEHLQTLYAQLFVLRTVEDRGLNDTIPPVHEALQSSSEFDLEKWQLIFARAREQIGSDLFSDDVASTIDPHILAGVVHDLYVPKKLPGADARYDFSWISADVLGLAYEKYLSTVLQPAPLPPQGDLFHQATRGVDRVSVRKSAGAYYTPRYLTTYLASTCVSRFFEKHSDPDALPRVIDFSCGSGSFLVAAVDQVLRHLKQRDPARAWAKELIENGCIAGIDIDQKAVTAARLHVWQRLIEEPGALPLPNLSSVIKQGDGLDTATWGELSQQYDIVLGNPPFLATNMVSNRARLEHEFSTAKGRYDFSSLFVEQALRVLKDGGVLGLVIPNRLFLNKSAEPLRALLATQAQLQVVVDFGSTKVFDADAYVGCIVAARGGAKDGRKAPLRVVQVRSLDPDYMTAELLNAEHADVGGASEGAVRSYIARQPGSTAWTLLSPSEQRNRVLLEEISVRLSDIATVAQGIRTGANDLYIVDVLEDDGAGLTKVRNGLGEEWFIETDILVPVVFGSELQRYGRISPSKRLIYAYRQNAPFAEAELNEKYPRTYEYFYAYRDLLSARSSLRNTGAKYYEVIRPRDERWLKQPKLLIRDLAPNAAFALDGGGSTFLVAGTAVVPADPDLCLPLLAYLNSGLVDSLLKQQTPSFRGDFQKFEPGVLSAIPVLRAVVEDEDLMERLSDFVTQRLQAGENETVAVELEAAIDKLIIEAARKAGAELVM